MDKHKELIEKMANKMFSAFRPSVSDGVCYVVAKELLSVILSDVSQVAMLCPECNGSGHSKTVRFVSGQTCPCNYCHGTSVTAKGGV